MAWVKFECAAAHLEVWGRFVGPHKERLSIRRRLDGGPWFLCLVGDAYATIPADWPLSEVQTHADKWWDEVERVRRLELEIE